MRGIFVQSSDGQDPVFICKLLESSPGCIGCSDSAPIIKLFINDTQKKGRVFTNNEVNMYFL